MQKWKTYLDEAYKACRVDPHVALPPIRITYRAMDANGNVQDFDNQTDANCFAGRPKHVVMIKNADDVQAQKDWHAVRQKVESYASDRWSNALRHENRHLNDDTFNLVYSKAYDKGHSSGYDSVVDYLDEIADFVDDIIAANK